MSTLEKLQQSDDQIGLCIANIKRYTEEHNQRGVQAWVNQLIMETTTLTGHLRDHSLKLERVLTQLLHKLPGGLPYDEQAQLLSDLKSEK